MKYSHIMLDLETLGNTADAVILSVAMVKFNLDEEHDDGMQVFLDVEEQMLAGRSCRWSSIMWWMEQDDAARKTMLAAEDRRLPVAVALEKVRTYINSTEYKIWANGASFDPPVLSLLFKQHMIEVPWNFRNLLDIRTIKWLSKVRTDDVPDIVGGTKHDALTDCLWQIQYLLRAMEVIKKK